MLYLPSSTACAAAQTDLKMATPGTGTGAPQMDQCLLTNTWPKTIHNINIHANKTNTKKQYNNT